MKLQNNSVKLHEFKNNSTKLQNNLMKLILQNNSMKLKTVQRSCKTIQEVKNNSMKLQNNLIKLQNDSMKLKQWCEGELNRIPEIQWSSM